MVNKNEQVMVSDITAGETAVDGLVGGLVAGLIMTVVLALFGLVRGEGPLILLGRFTNGDIASPWMGLLRHLAVSAVYGLLFGMIVWVFKKRFTVREIWLLAGLAYGLLLFAIAEMILLPSARTPLSDIPVTEFAIAHLVYGLALSEFCRFSRFSSGK